MMKKNNKHEEGKTTNTKKRARRIATRKTI
jgi:hypothetical protein